jgi:purine-cytosine permease-like protein
MEHVSRYFGGSGGRLISVCNTVQLAGWTVVMVVQAVSAVRGLLPALPYAVTALCLSALVLVWALITGRPGGSRLQSVIVCLLAVLCLALFAEASGLLGTAPASLAAALPAADGLSFFMAVELSAAMTVSWLPLVGDYSRDADGTGTAAAAPFIGYFVGAVAMNLFGLYLMTASGLDIFGYLAARSADGAAGGGPGAASPLRAAASAAVLLSTLTTAYLDLYSAAASSRLFLPRWSVRKSIAVIGLLTAAVCTAFPPEAFGGFLEGFLSAIGMVFVPVYAVLFTDAALRSPAWDGRWAARKLAAVLIGMAVYKVCERNGFGIPTLISMALASSAYLAIRRMRRKPR